MAEKNTKIALVNFNRITAKPWHTSCLLNYEINVTLVTEAQLHHLALQNSSTIHNKNAPQ